MKKLFLSSLFLFVCFFSSAQDQKRTVAFKLYANLDLWENLYEFREGGTTIEQSAKNVLYLSPAIIWGNNKNFQEIELSKFLISENRYQLTEQINFNNEIRDGEISRSIEFAFRYEYSFLLTGAEDTNLDTYIGLSASPYFQKIDVEPYISNIHSIHYTSFGFDFSVIPRINYHIAERLFIDLSVPINIGRLGYYTIREDNPAIPLQQQRRGQFDTNLFRGNSIIRLGTGIKI